MRRSVRILGITIAVAIGVTTVCLFRDNAPVQADGVLGLNFACTDGEFVASFGTSVIDLGLAMNAPWDAPSSGNGVYDADRWAVVFKFSSVTIGSGRIVRFINHPSRAPVIWLVEGDVDISINGTIDLRGEIAKNAFAGPGEPGPGGFRGGYGHSEVSGPSAGFGPGGAGVQSFVGGTNTRASSGSHATVGARGNLDDPSNVPGPIYGNARVLPLLGGSGGASFSGVFSPLRRSGGAGGGALLIVAGGSIRIDGKIDASGGNGGSVGGGAGGAIRLVAPVVSGLGRLIALGGISHPGPLVAGDGRIHIEADIIDLPQPGEPNFTFETLEDPPMIFPPPSAPRVRISLVGGIATQDDPRASFPFADVTLSTTDPVTVKVEAENLPLDATVRVRFVPRSGQDTWVDAHLDPDATNSFEQSTWTIDPLLLPDGFSIVQARAELPEA